MEKKENKKTFGMLFKLIGIITMMIGFAISGLSAFVSQQPYSSIGGIIIGAFVISSGYITAFVYKPEYKEK